MGIRDWFRPPRQILAIFLAVAVVSAGALAWLSWQLVQQDRVAEAQRQQDALEQTADRAVATLQRALADLQAQVGSEAPVLAPGVAAVSIGPDETRVQPAGAILYLPSLQADTATPTAVFADGERLEFVANDFPAATRAYTALASSSDPAIRAGALMRLGRVARKAHATNAALRAYEALEQLGSTVVEGLPSALVARAGRMSLFKETDRTTDLDREARALLADLQRGRWPITKTHYDTYAAEARSVVRDAAPDNPDAVARTEAVGWLWQNRADGSGRRVLLLSTGPVLLLWRSNAARVDAIVTAPSYLTALSSDAFPAGARWSLSDLDGSLLLGEAAPGRRAAVRTAVTAGLPWTLHVFPASDAIATTSPRMPLVLVIGLVTLVLAAGWYFIFRSLARERRVAELQSDFVAAVSHEFRSPLTSLSHAADLLARGRIESEEVRQQSYGVLVRDTARLRGLVEGLLDFGRFDVGAPAFRFDLVDLGALVRDTVADFQHQVASDGFHVELNGASEDAYVRGDREALTRALWNLLDNAVKYSPDCRSVWVDVERHPDRVAISVRDQGLGIPFEEQQVIFDRFVRGAESKSRRIRGTGIGLAMVRKIVEAHRGDVLVASEPGKGSRFTLILHMEGAV